MPDATVAELTAALWGRTGLETSRSSVLRALHRQGYSRKKSCSAVERSRPENLARRRVFCALLTLFQLERFVFLDESYCATGMRRDFAWARRGRRALSRRPFGKWRTVSLIAAMRSGERPRLMTHRGAVNGQVFLRFVRRRLVPWLRKGDIVCLDNLGTHKVKGVREAIQAAGAVACRPTART
jgi:hypothetical protein